MSGVRDRISSPSRCVPGSTAGPCTGRSSSSPSPWRGSSPSSSRSGASSPTASRPPRSGPTKRPAMAVSAKDAYRAHDFDRLARGDSFVHRRDARAKLLATLALILGVVRIPVQDAAGRADPSHAWKLLPLAAAVALLAALARLPP